MDNFYSLEKVIWSVPINLQLQIKDLPLEKLSLVQESHILKQAKFELNLINLNQHLLTEEHTIQTSNLVG
ncbi:hypothetical protein [Enterococcus sp. HY326]|uniref:hypothetical protein n=1 Tax=Enterococcus sp. HY326 TaxID=2971265 RepID=UPI002240C8F1|nr:hypothetical protein [Enterococcus sp. HY326]